MQKLTSLVTSPLRSRIPKWRRKAFEALGSDKYSRPALNALDGKLERYLDFDRGFFIEAGANDGFAQSNTYYFEKIRRWGGLLIEPVPTLAAACRKRRRATVVEAALVAPDYPDKTVELHFAGLMTTATGALGDVGTVQAHVERGLRLQRIDQSYTVNAPARTLSSILDDLEHNRCIDLLSLDVEGGEPQALRGIDFTRHAPRFICVETRDRRAIEEVLLPRYRLAEVLTRVRGLEDLLFQLV